MCQGYQQWFVSVFPTKKTQVCFVEAHLCTVGTFIPGQQGKMATRRCKWDQIVKYPKGSIMQRPDPQIIPSSPNMTQKSHVLSV